MKESRNRYMGRDHRARRRSPAAGMEQGPRSGQTLPAQAPARDGKARGGAQPAGRDQALLAAVQRRLGYSFEDPSLLAQALTHKSRSGSSNYERLEFLGDSVLGLAVAQELFRRFPAADEGQLTRLKARLVRRATLAQLARELDLGSSLNLGSSELKSGVFKRDTVLSDVLEAIIGALLLDSGFDQAARVLIGWFGSRLDSASPDADYRDPKTRLQEHLHSIGASIPEYTVLGVQGKSPSEEFEVECTVPAHNLAIIATGASIREAEQQAASRALETLQEAAE